MTQPIFNDYHFGAAEKAQLDRDGHFVLPGVLTEATQEKLIAALAEVGTLTPVPDHLPQRYSAEYNEYLASIIAHPQMLQLAHAVLGENIRYDHCVDLSRAGSDPGQGWHTHSYANDQSELGFVRIFFYVNGFRTGDGNLKVVPGSHLFREGLRNSTDAELQNGWLQNKTNPENGQPLQPAEFDVPAGTVILLWTHALHAVSPRLPQSPTRWAVVYAYRNPGAPSHARWVGEEFERNPPAGAESLMSLY